MSRTADLESGMAIAQSVARTMARKYRALNPDPNDFVSDALLALVKCLNEYDPELYDWERFVSFRARAGVLDGLRAHTKKGKRKYCSMSSASITGDEAVYHNLIDTRDAPDAAVSAEMFWKSLDQIRPRWSYVLRRRFRDDAVLNVIAAEINVNESRVLQIQKAALERLRPVMEGWL